MTSAVVEKLAQLPLELEEKAIVEEPHRRLFDCTRDSKLIAQGSHFHCQGCLIAKPLEVRSYDPRYCETCCSFLSAEGAMLQKGTRRPQWLPRRGGTAGQNNLSSESGIAILSAPTKRGRRAIELPEAVINSLIAEGTPRKEIAARMGISVRTLRRKLNGAIL